MTVREILEERRTVEMQINALQKQIDRCQSEGGPKGYPAGKYPEKIPGEDSYVMPLPGTNNPEAAAFQHADGYQEILHRLRLEKVQLMIDAERIIEAHTDGEARTILRYYYCLCYSDECIGREIGYDRKSIRRKRNEAVDQLEANLKVAPNDPTCPSMHTELVI